MKADRYGTPTEQTMSQAGWVAPSDRPPAGERFGGKCGHCRHVTPSAAADGKPRCAKFKFITRVNAICDSYEGSH